MALSHSSMTVFHLLVFLPSISHGFLHPHIISRKPPLLPASSSAVIIARVASESSSFSKRTSCIFASPSEDTNDDDDDDDGIDPNSLGDWRQFRMNLANSDSEGTSSSTSSIDGIELEDTKETPSSDTVASSSSSSSSSSSNAATPSARPKSVSKKNEELLNSQNAALAEEYFNGVWAHESPIVECGGLVCRLPLEAEIYRGNPQSDIHKKLRLFLDSEEFGGSDGDDYSNVAASLASSASTGGAASASSAGKVGAKAKGVVVERSDDDSAGNDDTDDGDDDDDDDANSSFSPLAAKTTYWYRGAEKLLKRELVQITSEADASGRLDPNALDASSVELLQLYMEHQQSWQEVNLVVERDERTGSAKTLTINRPMAFKLSESMGRLVLLGAIQAEEGGGAIERIEGNGAETQSIVKFLGAFENQCGVYVGGPDDMDRPATMVHGIENLPGAVEISPGTGIYRGGLEAACEGVLAGKYEPLDFRFFIGHTEYAGGELDEAVRVGKYQPVACSRPLVLKQCIQLPKPLWHEVLEFCGGELKEISKLEFAKRDDLQ